MSAIDKDYLDHRPSGKYQVAPWLNRANVFEAKCDRCKQKQLIYKVYSFMDRIYVNLCSTDLLAYYLSGLIHTKKSGEISTKSYQEKYERGKRSRVWELRYFCPKCSQFTNFYGHSKPIENENFEFSGNCLECNFFLWGDTYGLVDEAKLAKDALKREQEEEIARRNREANRKYFEDALINSITAKSTKKNSDVKQGSNKAGGVFTTRLFCEKCCKITSIKSTMGEITQDDQMFMGKCSICNQMFNGIFKSLHLKSQVESKEFQARKDAEVAERNKLAAAEYAESFFSKLRKKPKA